MKREELNEQLEAFFEHNPLDDDMQYLKKYVKEHPDNKMGWYLLGKEYAVRGKTGKAQYCFAQAGEVYEAFEKRKVKLDPLDALGLENPWLNDKKQSLKRRGKIVARLAAAVIAGLLLGTFFPLPIAVEKRAHAPESSPAATVMPLADGVEVLYTHVWAKPDERAAVAGEVLRPGAKARMTVLAEGKLTEDGKWVNWVKAPSVVLSAERSQDGGGTMSVRYHDAETCNCTPADAAEAEEAVKAWMAEEEQMAVLRSAMAAYKAKYGQVPETVDGIARDFPMNVLPGYTEAMKRAYPALYMAQAGTAASSADSSATGTATANRTKSATAAGLSEPLEIIVDKDKHRLALVSGKVILRNYPVGLGGERTPEGQFWISDKVRNPNGKSDGDFGSRGMQLSDTAYAIHGTNEPRSIGQDRSLGCVRMLKEDIEELFDMTPSGTKVTIGRGLLPAEAIRGESRFRLPQLHEETNPNKVYKWLG